MFKNILGGEPVRGAGSGDFVNTNGGFFPASLPSSSLCGNPPATVKHWKFGAPMCSIALILTGCASLVSSLPPANLKEPGWTIHQGQAVWRLEHGSREIAGEVMVATRPDGNAFVQFSKNPFALVIARENSCQWQVEFPPQNKHYAGRGKPPLRLIWLYLPRVLEGQPPPKGWTWQHDATGWRLANGTTGEALEGFFNDSAIGENPNPKSEFRKQPEDRNPILLRT